MKIKNLFVLATAAMFALSACQNDVDITDGDGQGEAVEGEKTYAVFKIESGEEGTRITTNTGGEENGIHNEAIIKTAGLYIFKWNTETTGEPEVMVDSLNAVRVASSSYEWEIPATAVMLTSGKKHIVVVANMSDDIKNRLRTAFADKSAGYDRFYQMVADLGASSPEAFDISTLFSQGDTKDAAAPFIVMSGETDRVLNAGVSQTEAQNTSNNNHVPVYVNRLPAKIDVRLGHYNNSGDQSVKTELPVPEEESRVGTAKNFVYDVRNQNRQEYIMKHITGSFVNTPWSAPGTTLDAARYYPIVTETSTFPAKLLDSIGWDSQNKKAGYRNYVTYIPENTNEVSLRGNTSYVALKSSYVPAEGCYVSGYINDPDSNNKVTLITETFPATVPEGNYALYNNDYNIAFKIETTADLAASDANLRALAGYHISRVTSVLGDINIDNVLLANDVTGFNPAQSISSVSNKTALAAATKDRNEATLWVKVEKTWNTDGKLEQIILTGAYYNSPGADGEYVANEGINFASLTCGLYTTDTVGLKSYYRVNIYDSALGITNMMYCSVVRNHSYHMVISKIKSIGYPTQIDLTIDPDEPLTNNTFVQAHVVINKWTYKAMNNVEIGM